MKKNFIWKLHSWTGLYAGLAIAFLSLTGTAALFRIEADHILNPDLRKVDVGNQQVSLNTAVESVKKQYENLELFEVELPKTQDGSWNIRFQSESDSKLFPVFWEVFVDPYSGKTLGDRNYYKTFSYYLRNIHVRFYEGYFGRQIVGLAGIALVISSITGLLIYGRFTKRQNFGKIRNKNIRTQQADYHKYIGITALVFNLMIAITGAWLGLQVYLQKWMHIDRPNTYISSNSVRIKNQSSIDFDLALIKAKSEFPELIPTIIRPTKNGTVEVIGDVAGKVYERNSNKLVLSTADYSTLFKYNISEATASHKLFFIQEALHFGDFGGFTLKLIYGLFGLTTGFLSLSGFIIYLERTKKQRAVKPSFQELGPVLWKYTFGLLAFCLITMIMSLIWGIGVPTLIVSVIFYSLLIFISMKVTFKFIINMFRRFTLYH
ncbi:PepSY-associated TM helix domain-containing protein [Fulvivirga lutea]|uniref:PepSY domain-containing protein n=1 Tax=Fulvivirga lutea TaxID=2810512 RepID=A0A974WFR2_9BACT|nr:PepSY-associated TM helix domain-containing protein [Fulvivirga lutea]QSE96197.1 PepSY domain-containing protein [Fulvivirga lutea]